MRGNSECRDDESGWGFCIPHPLRVSVSIRRAGRRALAVQPVVVRQIDSTTCSRRRRGISPEKLVREVRDGIRETDDFIVVEIESVETERQQPASELEFDERNRVGDIDRTVAGKVAAAKGRAFPDRSEAKKDVGFVQNATSRDTVEITVRSLGEVRQGPGAIQSREDVQRGVLTGPRLEPKKCTPIIPSESRSVETSVRGQNPGLDTILEIRLENMDRVYRLRNPCPQGPAKR